MVGVGAAVGADALWGALADTSLGASAGELAGWLSGIGQAVAVALGAGGLAEWLSANSAQQGAVVTFAQSNSAPLAQTIGQLMAVMLQITGQTRVMMDTFAQSAARLRTKYLPLAVSNALEGSIQWVQRQGFASLEQMVNALANLNDQVQTYTDTQVSAAINDAYTYTRQQAQATELAAEQFAGRVATGALDTATARLQQAETVISADINAVNQRVTGLAEREALDVGGLVTDVKGLAGQLAGDVNALANEIDVNKAAAAAAVGAVALTLTDWLKSCGDPLCNNLQGFGNDIAQLINAGELAALFAFLAYAIHSPEAAARDAEGPLSELVHAGQALYGQVV